MMSGETSNVTARAKRLYVSQLRERLELSEFGRYVSIEPETGDHFLGDTIDEAVNRALDKHPDRLTRTIRIGHRSAFHLGVLTR